MREKEFRYVVTFHTTAEAIAFEKACKEGAVAGRLIPVPRIISAGCGLAWSMPVNERETALRFIRERGLAYEAGGEYLI